MHVSKSRHWLRPCFVELCPHCRRIGEFWLTELSGQVALFGGTGYGVACRACSFEKLVSKAEAQRLATLAQEYDRLIAGQCSSDAFQAQVDATQVPAIEQIRAEAQTWRCTSCAEKNPPSFDLCWKCGVASPHPNQRPSESPRLPDVGGRHPWE